MQQPIYVLPEGTQRTIGKNAQQSNIMAARSVADVVKSTLGPKGMDKLLVDSLGDIIVTNDGVTILTEMQVEHPVAKMMVEVARTQEEEVGDGTTTAVVLAGEFLKKAEGLLEQGIHPTTIVEGYRMCADYALGDLKTRAKPITINDSEMLLKIAETAITGKSPEAHKSAIADAAVRSVLQIYKDQGMIDKNLIHIETKIGGSIKNIQLYKGIILKNKRANSSVPYYKENCIVLLIDEILEIKKTSAQMNVSDTAQLEAFLKMEEKILSEIAARIISLNPNIVFFSRPVSEHIIQVLTKAQITTIPLVPKRELERISKATNAKITNDYSSITREDLGMAGKIEEKDGMTFIYDCPDTKVVTILAEGSTAQVADEVKRSITDAVGDLSSALNDGFVVAGAGASEIIMSRTIHDFAKNMEGKLQLVMTEYASALECIPKILAENAGLDSLNVIGTLRTSPAEWPGINLRTGVDMDAMEEGILEPLKIKTQAITSATEVACMVLRIDDVIAATKLGNGLQ